MPETRIDFHPQQSFQHTMKEIAVNRGDPCEVVRELISNAYDAGATDIRVFPYTERAGLVFFDNGVGLSQAEQDAKHGVVPYVAFFSIGKTTKVRGQGIGYKCQGSKLCFASGRVTVLTRCEGEDRWRYIRVDDPKSALNEKYDLTPKETAEPWEFLESSVFTDPDERTIALIKQFDAAFFKNVFIKGTLVIIERFEVQDYEKYFSVGSTEKSYLYNYIRYYSAHGDVRRIDFAGSGFTSVDKSAVTSHIKSQPAKLQLFMSPEAGSWEMREVKPGFPYLPVSTDDEKLASPNQINRLRDARFCARYATVVEHGGQKYTFVLAIDAKRRALDSYRELGRQRNSACGIPISTQRGTFLAAQGVKICPYNSLFESDALAEFDVLRDNTEHHLFIIDGPFELITSRNGLAPSSMQLLVDGSFLDKVKLFLTEVRFKRPRGSVFGELVQRLGAERTHQREENYQKIMAKIKEDLPSRAMFRVTSLPVLETKWFFEPTMGEENFVGALFTLFAYLVDEKNVMRKYWPRPLTFKAFGIDAVSCSDESNLASSLEYLEYKYAFSTDVEFNHPFSMTKMIVCWDYTEPKVNEPVADSYDYVGKVTSFIGDGEKRIGFNIGDIRLRSGLNAIGNEIEVVSLKRLLTNTFTLERRQATPPTKKGAK